MLLNTVSAYALCWRVGRSHHTPKRKGERPRPWLRRNYNEVEIFGVFRYRLAHLICRRLSVRKQFTHVHSVRDSRTQQRVIKESPPRQQLTRLAGVRRAKIKSSW